MPQRAQPVVPTEAARVEFRPLAGGASHITGGFWSVRQERNGRAAIRDAYDLLEKAGNFIAQNATRWV